MENNQPEKFFAIDMDISFSMPNSTFRLNKVKGATLNEKLNQVTIHMNRSEDFLIRFDNHQGAKDFHKCVINSLPS